MVTLTVVLASVLVGDALQRHLCADVARALRRADLKYEWVADTLGVPRTKLSAQLNGHAPFTYLPRFFTTPAMYDTDFHIELLDLLAERLDRAVVTPDLAALIRGRKRMAKALLSSPSAHQQRKAEAI
jgi:hypothetical protein